MFLKIVLIFAFSRAVNGAAVLVGNGTINMQEIFQTNCRNELKVYIENTQKELNATHAPEKFNITSIECLMFCGYKKVGVLDTDGNIMTSYLKNLVSSEYITLLEPAISKCASIEKTTNVCEKALKNIKCVFEKGLEIVNIRS